MDIPREQEREAISEKETLKAFELAEENEDRESATESSLPEKRDIIRGPYNTQNREGEAPAVKSTGPRTQRGKENSKHNALKHGIFSQVVLLKGDPRAEFDSLLHGLQIDLKPEGTLEELLVDKLAAIVWRLRRLIIAGKEQTTKKTGLSALLDDGDGTPRLELLLRYESNLERAFDRTLNQLERLKRIRNGEAVPPVLDVNVST